MFLFYFLVIDFVNCQPEFNQEDFFDRPVSPWERQHRPPWHHGPPPPPWRRRPPPPWLRGPPPPWHHGPPPPLPPWAGPPLFPPPPPPLLPSNQESSVQFSPSIDKVVNSVNRNTAAFQKPGESYDRVIQLMATFFNRKSNSQYDVSKNIPQNGISNNEASYNSKIAAAMFESDMVLTVGQINEITNNNNKRIKRKININGTTWGTRISYQFLDTDVTWQSHINNALRFYELNTCIRFVLNEASADYIVFNKGEGCYSSVGKLGGPQEVSIGNGCESLGIITHEVGHSLGFWHEQARPERDSYVRINRQNAVSGLEGQFEKRTWAEVANYNIPYDYGSVMHYSSKAFSQSSNLNTIEPFDMAFLSTIGNRNEPTFLDLKALNLAFCKNICPNVINCLNSGYPDPNNCGRCKCPTGLEGLYCEKLQTSSCGVEVPRIDYKWQTITYSGSSDCYWRISAPSNSMKIRYHLTHVMYKCSPACEEFVEIKAEQNHETTGFRHCCRVDIGERVSKNDNILIISKATTTSQFVLKYRIDGAPPVKNIPIPPTSTYNSQWSAWTACTENCGACGTQYRQRCTSANCINPITQTRVCNKQPCSPGTTKRTEKSLARYKRYGGEWCCARFVLSGRVCVPVRTG